MDVPALISRHMKAKDISAGQLARVLGLHKPFVFAIKAGTSPLPVARAEAWADALSITGDEREEFILAVYLARSSPYIRSHVAKLEAQVASLKKSKK